MTTRLRWRKLVSGFMLTMTGVCAVVAVSALFFILGYLVFHGGTSISWNFFTKLPAPVGEPLLMTLPAVLVGAARASPTGPLHRYERPARPSSAMSSPTRRSSKSGYVQMPSRRRTTAMLSTF